MIFLHFSALKGSTAETPEVVNDFLQILAEKLRPHSEKDLGVMRSMKKADIGAACVRKRTYIYIKFVI